ncbi:O-methyltransferase [Allokutzneria albata]|uniref:Caffeoyl-CoA O-methyltransferase n=1 Tax=Allokutzneria albata TaxID=211114 RepID=A0A1G9VU44_ALLAB|nr:class I SAM-dependent methyltransferase [Allokutzneria albata]SDM75772.1 caffeoyl-CoA O-methyltransferase [Allokutzneria albata]
MEILAPAVSDYLLENCTPADDLLRELAEETRTKLPDAARMQISHDEGEFLTMLTRLIGARRVVEVGVFTGYSSICIARGMPADGHLLACDVSEEWTAIARGYWERAGLADRIELRIAPALETLRSLPADPVLDMAFVDADKVGYPDYYAELVPRLRRGGLIVLDNVFRGGGALDPNATDEGDIAMRRMNEIVMADDRVDSVMLPVRDGVTLARKR